MTENETPAAEPDEVERGGYAAFVDSLADILDVRGGLAEVVDVARYNMMRSHVVSLLDLEAGLQSALVSAPTHLSPPQQTPVARSLDNTDAVSKELVPLLEQDGKQVEMSRTDREAFAQRWADEIAGTSYISMQRDELVARLLRFTDQLVEGALAAELDPSIGHRIGFDMVSKHVTGTRTLDETVALIVERLPDLLEQAPRGVDVAHRVVRLVGNVAAGYASALYERSLDEQNEIRQTELRARKQAEQALAASEARFRGIFSSSPLGIAISEPGGRIVQVNRSLEDILGYSSAELLGRELSELFSPNDRLMVEGYYRDLVAGRDSRSRVRALLPVANGETALVELGASMLRDAEQAPMCIVTMIDDITDMHLLGQRLRHQTLHDALTGLPNRQYFMTYLEIVLGKLPSSAVVTLMYLDLDGFSAINDGLGHRAGDQLLNSVARRLEAVVAGQQAMVARFGADEYAILIEPGDSVLDVSALAEAINTKLAEPVYIDGIGASATASIGVVQRPIAMVRPEELMRAASATLRRIHGSGTRQWALFDLKIDATDRLELQLAAAMPGALETGELEVTYQPVATLNSERLVGIEAALSWRHPQWGVLAHEQCVKAAERTGAVHAVGQWLLRTAAEQALSWHQRTGNSLVPMMVNLMPSQALDPNLVTRVKAVLEETGLPPGELELRAPVAAVAAGELSGEGGERAEDNLRALTELGVRTGYYEVDGGIGESRCVTDL